MFNQTWDDMGMCQNWGTPGKGGVPFVWALFGITSWETCATFFEYTIFLNGHGSKAKSYPL